MLEPEVSKKIWVICRIGSLEKRLSTEKYRYEVICRIGSLETALVLPFVYVYVICRIGRLYIS